MNYNGQTEDYKAVMGDIFRLVGTHGLPLEIILMKFQEWNYVVDWVEYIKDAMKDGAKLRTIKGRILSAVADVYGPKYRDEVEKRIDIFYADNNLNKGK